MLISAIPERNSAENTSVLAIFNEALFAGQVFVCEGHPKLKYRAMDVEGLDRVAVQEIVDRLLD
eukprot:2724938-Lingulodinium_polyedra.AAC.1